MRPRPGKSSLEWLKILYNEIKGSMPSDREIIDRLNINKSDVDKQIILQLIEICKGDFENKKRSEIITF